LVLGGWLLATPVAAEDRRREPQKCEERCGDVALRCRETCKKFASNEACFKSCTEQEQLCTQQCRQRTEQ
jgi:hypothetical protein